MSDEITRSQLGLLIEDEGFLNAGSRIFGGDDPIAVLSDIADQLPRYGDAQTTHAFDVFDKIVRNEITVVEDAR